MTPGAREQRPQASTKTASKPVEIWGGIECTVNRVGDRYYDQVALTGHCDRFVDDLTRLADLGIRTLRYPVLWERVAPGALADADWSQCDVALEKMGELGITPIVGLIHHGSGPQHTSLLDPEFAHKLSEFAGAVARRYPWVTMYTPINEPLTTARFATLYGHWYPHARDDRSFARAVLNQCAAIRECMSAIRGFVPQARLIQTEDLGTTYSTASLAYQATFDNNRRWLTFDILSGRLDEWHPLWWYLLESGVTRQELESFLSRPCVPDTIGINHYVTSDRFLDDRVELYPAQSRGGNGRHAYADVEAVRTVSEEIGGHVALLRQAWTRYALPMAITEVHLACTREEQLRWLNEAWSAANELRGENIDVRAVTVWSLFGCYGWRSLLTSDFDSYEPGAFDLRSLPPRKTAVATMAGALATKGEWDHPVLDGKGWWRRDSRFMHRVDDRFGNSIRRAAEPDGQRMILIAGCNGTLGRAFQRLARDRGLAFRALGRSELDVTHCANMRSILDDVRPWAVINAAGYVRVDDAEDDATRCCQVNDEGAFALAAECAQLGIKYATFSSDLVFDGTKSEPYIESDRTNPRNVYGASKARMEERVSGLANTLVIRTSAFFGPWDPHNFLARTFDEISCGRPTHVANDTIISPTYLPDLVNTTLDLLIDGEVGIWHLANDGALSWFDFARQAANQAGLDTSLIIGRPINELKLRAARPRNSVLGSERGKLMPTLEDAINRWLGAMRRSEMNLKVLERSRSV